jgi:hypothetical protein
VIEDADGLAEALKRTALVGFPEDEELGETLVVPDIEPDDLLGAWCAARSVVPTTGRRPVVVATDDKVLDGEAAADFESPVDYLVTDEVTSWALGPLHGVDLSSDRDGRVLHDNEQMAVARGLRRRCQGQPVRDGA